MAYVFKIVNVFLLATVKYFYTPIYAYAIDLDFWSTMFTMIIGGILGFLLFYYFSNIIILSSNHIKPRIKKVLPEYVQKKYRNYCDRRFEKRKNRRKFTRRNRFLVKFSSEYGMTSLVLLTPILISIPMGEFLIRRYYRKRSIAIPMGLLAIIVEGVILVTGYWHLMGMF